MLSLSPIVSKFAFKIPSTNISLSVSSTCLATLSVSSQHPPSGVPVSSSTPHVPTPIHLGSRETDNESEVIAWTMSRFGSVTEHFLLIPP